MESSTTSEQSRADAKTVQSSEKQRTSAQLLPISLLLHLMRFFDDFRSLARFPTVCRNWNALTSSQLDLCWRPLYLRDWEAESATDGIRRADSPRRGINDIDSDCAWNATGEMETDA